MDQRLWVAQQLAQALLDLAEPRRPAGRHSKASGGNGPPGRTFLATIAGTVTQRLHHQRRGGGCVGAQDDGGVAPSLIEAGREREQQRKWLFNLRATDLR
jgi:hypothetical protein